MGYIADLLKPILTILVTGLALAFLASVFSPVADGFIEDWIPAWARLDGAIEQCRTWLGLTQR